MGAKCAKGLMACAKWLYDEENGTACGQTAGSWKRFFWDKDTKEVLGRTCWSWFELTAFYLIYYSCMAAIYAATVGCWYDGLAIHEPFAVNKDNCLSLQPGLGFTPQLDVTSSMVYLHESTNTQNVAEIKKFLSKYTYEQQANNFNNSLSGPCSDFNKDEDTNKDRELREREIACSVDFSQLNGTECGELNNYGYDDGKPCLLIRLNNIYNYNPIPMRCNEVNPKNKPKLVKHCNKEENLVYVSCDGASQGDRDNIIGDVKYFPTQGFPLKYFPYLKQPNYLQPIVMVKVEVTRFVPVVIVCKALALNIDVSTDGIRYEGSARIDLLVDFKGSLQTNKPTQKPDNNNNNKPTQNTTA